MQSAFVAHLSSMLGNVRVVAVNTGAVGPGASAVDGVGDIAVVAGAARATVADCMSVAIGGAAAALGPGAGDGLLGSQAITESTNPNAATSFIERHYVADGSGANRRLCGFPRVSNCPIAHGAVLK